MEVTKNDATPIENSLEKLREYIEKEQFRGYDPYDTLNSFLKFRFLGRFIPILAIQFQKRNPINIRPILGIKKDYNPKALGLFLYAYSRLQKNDQRKEYSKQINFLFSYLTEHYSKGYAGYCWGYNFDWASSGKYIRAFSPNIVVTAFIAKGIFAYYQLSQDPKAYEVLKSIGNFITKDLHHTETKEGTCFSYTTLGPDCCYNASLLAAQTLAYIFSITREPAYKNLVEKAVDFVVKKQFADGHWNYSMEIATGKEREQIDFHQGYIIDSIKECIHHCGLDSSKYEDVLEKGMDFYKKRQFFEDGRSKWRIPKIYPVEIHNQSQGIITFSSDEKYRPFAVKIAGWTQKNMQGKKGNFYYRKLRVYSNRISYMRWSQAWMFVALADLWISLKDKKY